MEGGATLDKQEEVLIVHDPQTSNYTSYLDVLNPTRTRETCHEKHRTVFVLISYISASAVLFESKKDV